MMCFHPNSSFRKAFTLVELLVAMAVLALLLVLLTSATSSTLSTISHASAKIDQFASARAGFDLLSQTLSQATLNTYYDYYNANGDRRTQANAAIFDPSTYGRYSDLHFKIRANALGGQEVFFQTPLSRSQTSSAEGALNAVGYWIEYGPDNNWRPPTITTERSRFRLMQGIQPAENMEVFDKLDDSWISKLQQSPSVAMPIADNVIAMVIHPRLPKAQDPNGDLLTANYEYDSRGAIKIQQSQLPPALQLSLVVIDESSAARLDAAGGTAIQDALAGKFVSVVDFDKDLEALEKALSDATPPINYLVLSAPLTLRESKFSNDP